MEVRSKGFLDSAGTTSYNNYSAYHEEKPEGGRNSKMYRQSLDEYFLGGANSDKSHVQMLSKTILNDKSKPRHAGIMAPTAVSMNAAMRVFHNQQRVL